MVFCLRCFVDEAFLVFEKSYSNSSGIGFRIPKAVLRLWNRAFDMFLRASGKRCRLHHAEKRSIYAPNVISLGSCEKQLPLAKKCH
jgi:hypothetical protein